MPIKSLELLELIMGGNAVEPAHIDDLINNKVGEDLFLDYKHGNILNNANAAEVVREYTAAFANSSGGVLIIGLDNTTWTVTDCPPKGSQPLDEWAASCLSEIAPYFSPPARAQVVVHPNGQVLIVAASRSLTLVPCIKARQIKHYFRFHDKTLEAPEYLISDLVLGRRNHPQLDITDAQIELFFNSDLKNERITYSLGPNFVIENKNLAWASDVKLGIIARVKKRMHSRALGDALRSYLDIMDVDPTIYNWGDELVHIVETIGDIDPLEVKSTSGIDTPTIPRGERTQWYAYTWEAAVYLFARGSPPTWYQLSLTVNQALHHEVIARKTLNIGHRRLSIKKILTGRVNVGWRDLRHDDFGLSNSVDD